MLLSRFTHRVLFSAFISALSIVISPPIMAQTLPGMDCAQPNDSRCEAWLAVVDYPMDYPLTFISSGNSLALGGDDKTAYVSGYARDKENPFESKAVGIVAAVDIATGQQRWLTTISPTPYVTLSAITAAGDGTVVVTGKAGEAFFGGDTAILVAALDPNDGTLLWQKVINPSPSTDVGLDIAAGISPTGNGEPVVVVTGWMSAQSQPKAAYTLAFSTDGALRWTARYDGGREDLAWEVEIAGGQALVAIQSLGQDSPYDTDIVTAAYALDDGALAWANRYKPSGAGAQDAPRVLAVSPNGATVVVAGYSNAATQGPPFVVDYDAVMIAYDTQSGIELWRHRWRASDSFLQWSSATSFPVPRDVVVTPERVIFTAAVVNAIEKEGLDIATVALDLDTGYFEWIAIESAIDADFELPNALAYSPDSNAVIMVGQRSRSDSRFLYAGQTQNGAQIVLAYAAEDGSVLWKAELRYSHVDDDSGRDVAITSTGTVVTSAQLKRNIEFDRDFYDIGLAAYQ